MSTLAKTLSLISALFMLTACGGGGSSVSRDNTDNGSGDGGTTSPTYSIALTLENESGASDNSLSDQDLATRISCTGNRDVQIQMVRVSLMAKITAAMKRELQPQR